MVVGLEVALQTDEALDLLVGIVLVFVLNGDAGLGGDRPFAISAAATHTQRL